ncbi:MAG: hypothetical protein WCW56_01015 [Candidatus Paceibacterota bacterium]|jgi:hypothetical protein
MKNYIIVAIVIILIIAGVVWYSNKGTVAPVDNMATTTAPAVEGTIDTTAVDATTTTAQ